MYRIISRGVGFAIILVYAIATASQVVIPSSKRLPQLEFRLAEHREQAEADAAANSTGTSESSKQSAYQSDAKMSAHWGGDLCWSRVGASDYNTKSVWQLMALSASHL